VSWGDVWGGAAWGAEATPPAPFEINITINVSAATITSLTGGLSVVSSKSNITSSASWTSSVGALFYVDSLASGLSTVTASDSIITSLGGGLSSTSVKDATLRSTASGLSSTKTSQPTLSSTAAGLSNLSMVRISITSTAYEFSPDAVGIQVSNPSITSSASALSSITVNKSSIASYAAGMSVIAVPDSYIVSGVELARLAYAMNVKTAEVTKFTNYDFIAIIRIGLDKYGVKPTGLYRLKGTTDNGTPIVANFTTHETRYDTNLLKRIPQVYIDSEHPTTVQPIIDGVTYHLHNSGFGGHKTKLGRGYIGKWWQWKISNLNGAAMRVGAIESVVENMSRRI